MAEKYVTERTPILGGDTTWIREIPAFGSVPDLGEKLPDVAIPTVKENVFDFAVPATRAKVPNKVYNVTSQGYAMLSMPGSSEIPRMWIVSLIAGNEKGLNPAPTSLQRILQEFPDGLKDVERLLRDGYIKEVREGKK